MKKLYFILFPLLIILLGCVSNPAKAGSQIHNIEISRDECIKKAINNDPEHPGKQCSLRISELVSMFLISDSDSNGYIDWETGAGVDTPINWKEDSPGCVSGGDNSFARCGEIFVITDGSITHTVLEKTIQPGTWSILLSGARIGVVEVTLSVTATSALSDMIDQLKKSNITVKLLKKIPREDLGVEEELYEIKAPHKEKAWLAYTWSCGASGMHCDYTMTIFYDIDAAMKSLQPQTTSEKEPVTEKKNSQKNLEQTCVDDVCGSGNKTDNTIQEIKNRCQTQMSEYGAAMVKSCVDQDIEAIIALKPYLATHGAIVGRCFSQMKENGYAMVKACTDQDIEAEEALRKY